MKSLKDTINETILSRKLSDPIRLTIEEWLEQYDIENYTIRDNHEIDVKGDVDLVSKKFKELPDYIQFGTVEGSFDCRFNKLTSLRGCPRKVEGYFDCSHNKLTTLKGAPEIVEESFYCTNNSLTTLEGSPREVGRDFYCSDNDLTLLDGAPKEIKKTFVCKRNITKLSIEDVKRATHAKYIVL